MKAFLTLLIAVFVLGATAAGGYLLYKQRSVTPAPAKVPPTSQSQPAIPAPPTGTPIAEALKNTTADPATLEKLTYEIKKNADTVGWLAVPGTEIDNAVLQYHNNSYYLRRDERKNDSLYGCYFADFECGVAPRDLLSQNTVIYGHSDLKDNPDGPKFSQLFQFTDKAFADANKTILLTTPEETLEWEIFTVFYTDITFDYIRVNMTEAELLTLAQKAQSMSLYNYGVSLSGTDKIITLSTCSVKGGNDGNHRFVVMGRLKPAAAAAE